MILYFKNLPNLKLETDRLLIRPLIKNDIQYFNDIVNIENNKYLESTVNDAINGLIKSIGTINLNTIILGIHHKANNHLIGYKRMDFYFHIPIGSEDNPPFIYFDGIVNTTSVLNKQFWGNGFMTEASKVLYDFLFNTMTKAIVSTIKVSNTRAINYNKKLGFKPISFDSFNNLGFMLKFQASSDIEKKEDIYLLKSPMYDNIPFDQHIYQSPNNILAI